MTPITSGSIVVLSDLVNEPVHKAIGCFKIFASTYSLQPFKLITFNNPVLISRFKLDIAYPMVSRNFFLSILLVKTSIDMEDVNDFVLDLAAPGKLSPSARIIYENIIRDSKTYANDSGRAWALRQAKFGMRILATLAREAGVEMSPVNEFSKHAIVEALGLDESKWQVFSVIVFKSGIQTTPDQLLDSTFGLN